MAQATDVQQQKRLVGIFKSQEDVENAIRAIKDADVDMNHVSLLARNVEDVAGGREVNENQGNEASEGAGIGATTGTVLGGVTGFLIGVGVLAIPGVGPILAAGTEISALASTLAGAGVGAATGGIVGALVGLGIPEEKARVYEDRIKAGDYLLMVSGDDDTIRRAESIMGDHHADDLDTFEVPSTEIRRRQVETNARFEGQPTHESAGRQVTTARDIDDDREPEVVVVDERQAPEGRQPKRR
jgi:hypothetical protein